MFMAVYGEYKEVVGTTVCEQNMILSSCFLNIAALCSGELLGMCWEKPWCRVQGLDGKADFEIRGIFFCGNSPTRKDLSNIG